MCLRTTLVVSQEMSHVLPNRLQLVPVAGLRSPAKPIGPAVLAAGRSARLFAHEVTNDSEDGLNMVAEILPNWRPGDVLVLVNCSAGDLPCPTGTLVMLWCELLGWPCGGRAHHAPARRSGPRACGT